MNKIHIILLSWVISLTLFSWLYAAEDHNGSRSNTTESEISTPIDIVDIESDVQNKSAGFTPFAGAALGITCLECDFQEEVKIETAAGPLTLGLGAIIAIGADNCKWCLFEEGEEDIEDITMSGPDGIEIGDLIALGATDIENDEDTYVHCEVTEVEDKIIECEVISVDKQVKEDELDILAWSWGMKSLADTGNPCTGPEDESIGCDGLNTENKHVEGRELAALSVTCVDCWDNGKVEIETADGALAIWLGAIIIISAAYCEDCTFETALIEDLAAIRYSEDISDPLVIWLGTIIAIGGENIEDDEDVIVHCKITNISDTNIECEIVSLNKEDFYRIEGHQGKNMEDTVGDNMEMKSGTGLDGWEDRLTENVSINCHDCHDESDENVTWVPVSRITSVAKSTRAKLKETRKEYISTYKTAFVERIGSRLDNIPASNLEIALEKINAKMDKVEANENMSDNAKETLMDALFALLEIVELKLEWIDWE